MSYGATVTGVTVYVSDVTPFCVGATFDLVAVGTQFDTEYQIESFSSADVSSIDTAGCGGAGRAPAVGELLIVINTATFSGSSSDDASWTLNPDLDDEDASADSVGGFVLHSTVDSAPFSPGTHIDGAAF